MIEPGANVFRFDFERVYPLMRKAAKELGKKVPRTVFYVVAEDQWKVGICP